MALAQSVAIVSRSYKSSWKSCQSIVANIGEFIFQDCQRINYDEGLSSNTLIVLAEKLKELAPKVIVFSDHLPHPVYLVQALKIVYQDSVLPKLVFYIYGDFSVQSREWIALGKLIRGTPTQFFFASKKQKMFFSQFLFEKHAGHVVPFPINSEIFHFSAEKRRTLRLELGWNEDQFIIIYSGRISLQKNILGLSAILKQVLHQHTRVQVIFMGPSDDIGAPYFRLRLVKDGYKKTVFNFWSRSPNELNRRVTFLNDQPQDEIAKHLLAADLFVSLSSYHDEDFGMAPLEAAACGCRLLLSDWAGYSDFKKIPGTFLLPIRENKGKLGFSKSTVLKEINKLIPGNESVADKEARSLFVANEYFAKIREKTWMYLSEDFPLFKGFSEKLATLNGAYSNGSLADKGFETYRDLYEVYWDERPSRNF